MLSVTEAAQDRISEILKDEKKPDALVRVFISGVG
jgi:Fe-S cluster assembly iron-binding protein IscA